MFRTSVFRWCWVVAVCLVVPTEVMADFWEDFDDLNFWHDPNFSSGDPNLMSSFDPNLHWDPCDPQWWLYPVIAHPQDHFYDVSSGALRMWGVPHPFIPFVCFVGAAADDSIYDANASDSYWTDTQSHHVLCKVYYPGSPNDPTDPNHDCGAAFILIHGHPVTQSALGLFVSFINMAHRAPGQEYAYASHLHYTHNVELISVVGTQFENIQRAFIDPNGIRDPNNGLDPNTADPNDTLWLEPPEPDNRRDPNYDTQKWLGMNLDQMERDGIWCLLEFEPDPNYVSGDPNGKYMRAAIWGGSKYDWDGEWLLNINLGDEWWQGDADKSVFYHSEGRTFFGAMSADYTYWGNGYPADCVYDEVEARTGFRQLYRKTDLTITNPQHGSVSVLPPPDVYDPDDPNADDHRVLRYADGTALVLTAEPVSGKSLKQWTIYDPNFPGDDNYAVTDTNSVLYLTLDANYEVNAHFKCGGSVPPFVALALLALALTVVIRRVT